MSSDPVLRHTDYEGVVQAVVGPKCDDCRRTYEGPAYYTFDLDTYEGRLADHGYHESDLPDDDNGCTGNLCPMCSDDLTPDDPDDLRRPR